MISKDYEVIEYLKNKGEEFNLSLTFENVIDSVVVRLTYNSTNQTIDFTGVAYDNGTIEEAIDSAHIKLYNALGGNVFEIVEDEGEVIGSVIPSEEIKEEVKEETKEEVAPPKEEVAPLEDVVLPKKEHKEPVETPKPSNENVHPLVSSGQVRQDQMDSLKKITEDLNIHTEEKFSAVLYNWAEFSGYFSINSKMALCTAGEAIIDDFIKFATLTIINHEGVTFEDLEKAGF